MCLQLPDDILREAHATSRDAMVELACRWFDSDRLSLPAATRLSGLSRPEFENELAARGIAAYRPTVEDLEEDMRTLRVLEKRELPNDQGTVLYTRTRGRAF